MIQCMFCRQQLLTQYRAQILSLRRQLNTANVGLHRSLNTEQLKNVEAENVCRGMFVSIPFHFFLLCRVTC